MRSRPSTNTSTTDHIVFAGAGVDRMVMQGYDLDDTLARVDFSQAARTSLVDLFTAAPVIFVPSVDFVVITGRPHASTAQRDATAAWLAKNEPACTGIHYVEASSTSAAVAASKAVVINRLKLSDYTDNNVDVLSSLSKLTSAKLWRMNEGTRTAFVSADRAALARLWAPTLQL